MTVVPEGSERMPSLCNLHQPKRPNCIFPDVQVQGNLLSSSSVTKFHELRLTERVLRHHRHAAKTRPVLHSEIAQEEKDLKKEEMGVEAEEDQKEEEEEKREAADSKGNAKVSKIWGGWRKGEGGFKM